ncbi:hypothetical protein AB0G60_20495 [Streptomyces angustmyceticus]|uniref:Uncharacterized protein n=1 Tax=Streptomyces angustmyceticus TaxID=285578 RepID=A0A5J4LEF0_9ACTN|nr:hypothetical protein [Streptomyces angustmyceticus]UAL66639.1 hypothetical protein K7396_08900 [Streptomyces angustmyceticus]GES28505.1 hypothetical protein San01_09920 [Streptomyces angustmyceticus]
MAGTDTPTRTDAEADTHTAPDTHSPTDADACSPTDAARPDGRRRAAATRPARPPRRPRGSSRAAGLCAAALALALPLAACSADGGGDGRAGGSRSPAAGPAPSPSATPTVDPAAYRRALTGALGPLDGALRAVDDAHDGGPLGKALDRAAARADTAADTLQSAAAPDAALAGNGRLVTALRALGQDLRSARGSGGRCATSPRVELRTARSPQSIKEAGRALAAVGYDVTLRLPRTERAEHRRLANGALVRDGSRVGLGRLTVRNGTAGDAVVTLTRGGRTAFSLYVRKGSEATVGNVNSGSYAVYFTTGEDWNGAKRSFTRGCSFEKFDDSATFRTVRVAGGTRYTVLTFTLNKVIGGNARTSTVPPDEFPS